MPVKSNSSSYGELKRPAVFAHRGASAYAPENTMTAFLLALNQGADAIELDAKLTADGQVIAMHDDTVNRTTDGSGSVKSLTLADLLSLDAGSKFAPAFKSEKVPSLEQVFETLGRKIFINVELTNYSSPLDDLADKVTELVKKYNLVESVLLSSFNLIALIQAKKSLPKVALGFLTYTGVAEAALRSRLVRFGPSLALHASYSDVTPYLVQALQQARSRIHVYTVNQPEEIQKLYKAGVDGIFTADPQLARRILAEDQHWKL
jgi:glycerophosphoryl diester phosphodiesterase